MNPNDLEILTAKYKHDFNTALNIYENSYSHEKLIEFLKSGSVAEKQASVLKLECIKNEYEAEVLINNLTGCDGKIREAVSFRLKDFVPLNPEYYKNFANIFLDAVIDINGNICRNTIEAIQYLKGYPEFIENFCLQLTENALNIALKVKDFDIQEGKYKINKEVFKLYWYLETISGFTQYIQENELLKLLSITKDINEYTIRGKTAKILTITSSPEFSNIKSELKNDRNYYVRRMLY